jgi:hypothetical protein
MSLQHELIADGGQKIMQAVALSPQKQRGPCAVRVWGKLRPVHT